MLLLLLPLLLRQLPAACHVLHLLLQTLLRLTG
jgi:hypothetical protein